MYETSTFTHRGYELTYDTYGSGERLLVYTHGLLLDSDLNRGIARSLAEAADAGAGNAAGAGAGNKVVLLDLLGHGRSDHPTHASAYRIDSYASQVFALLDHLGAEQAVLGGLSLGANVSLFAATEHPERVRGLVLEMPVMEWAVPSAALAFVPMLLAAHYAKPVLRVTSGTFRRLPRTPFDPLNSLMHGASLPPEIFAAILHGVLVGPVVPTVEQRRSLEVPTLVLAHSHDLIHPFDDAVNLAKQLPHARLVRARSPLELRLRPDRLTDSIASFLAEAWADAPTVTPI